MYLPDPGWLRPLLTFVLLVLGVVLRFTLPSRVGGFAHRAPDDDLVVKARNRIGEMVLLWALWVLAQMAVGMRESWLTSVWAPLIILGALGPSYIARLYLARYQGGEVAGSTGGSWLAVALREAVPLGAILVSILVVRQSYGDLPDRIPTGWDWRSGSWILQERNLALDTLRHRTMLVYMVLFGLEGAYLVVRWVWLRDGDFAGRMLSRPHWLYFLFKLGWVLLFVGLNLGCIEVARDEGPILPYLLPGLFVLSVLGILAALRGRRPSSR